MKRVANKNEPKKALLRIRVTEAQLAELDAAAKRGSEGVSSWVRRVALREARKGA